MKLVKLIQKSLIHEYNLISNKNRETWRCQNFIFDSGSDWTIDARI